MTTTVDGTSGVVVPGTGSVVLNGATSGSITLAPAAVAGSNTLTLPAATGTLLVPGNASALTAGTVGGATGNSQVLYSSIPSWVRRITWMINSVTTSTNGNVLWQIGTSGGMVTSGYTAYSAYAGGSNISGGTTFTGGFGSIGGNSANALYGHVILTHLNSNTWICSYTLGVSSSGPTYLTFMGGGSITLSGTLTQTRMVINDGANFSAGNANIIYE